MCGIAGIFDGDTRPSEDALLEMRACLTHRGPDQEGIHVDGTVGLAHKRLSIVGVESGRQPIFNEDGSVCVVFNGEIYNHRRLRENLETGHTFTTETDTEVLVHLYEEHGPAFVNDLSGMFAFALWDADEGRLLLARDCMGIKPLCVANDGDRIAFASELPALLESPVDHGDIDQKAVSEYFAFGHVPAPRTMFENVRKLTPGELLIVDDRGISSEKFSSPTTESRDPGFEEAARELRNRVESAVEARLMSDVPLGAFLSGGIDSSIVAGTMADLADDPVKTFTVGFEQSLFDESWAAREVAEYHNTDHTEFTVTPADVRESIPAVLDRLGEPFADQSLIPTYVIARETSQDVKVALSGDGADELFAGYDRYRGEYYSGHYRRLPRSLRDGLIEPAVRRMNASRTGRRGEVVRKARKFLRGDVENVADRHFEWNRVPDDEAATALNGTDPVAVGRERMQTEHEGATAVLPAKRRDDMARILAVDTRFGLPNQILHKTDLASMYNSLEVRVPFLDTAVVKYATSLPTNYKINRSERKRVLKRAFRDRLPTAILERDKQGFDMPIGEWLKDELADEFRTAVTAVDTDAFERSDVLEIFDDHRDGTSEHGKFLWSVYVFSRWHRRLQADGII